VLFALLLGLFNSASAYVNVYILKLPLFMDTIGTLISTVFLDLIPGLLTAAATHLIPELTGWYGNMLPWMLCSMVSAVVIWGLCERHHFHTVIHGLFATVFITFANAITGAVIAVFFYSGMTDHPVDYLVTSFLSIGQNLISAAFWSRLPINLIDKGIAVYITLGLLSWCRYRIKSREGNEPSKPQL